MKRYHFSSYGFTLIEIIIVLVLLGILAATAVPKYFDLQAEAQKKAFQSTVAEAQGRINTRFGQLLLEGNSCEKAVEAVSTLDAIEDKAVGVFGEHVLQIEGKSISRWGTAVQAKRTEDADSAFIDTGAKLYVAACDTSLDTYLDTTVKGLIEKFWDEGHRDRDTDEFIKKYLQKITLGNGTTVQLDKEHGNLVGNTGTPASAKLQLNFKDKNGNLVNIQFTTRNDGTTTIHQLYLTPVATRKKVQIIHSSFVNAKAENAQTYKKIMDDMGIDTSKFEEALTNPEAKEFDIL